MMANIRLFTFFIGFFVITLSVFAQPPRIVVLTDITNEPDDAQALVRLLLYANDVEIEGIVAVTSVYLSSPVVSEVHKILDAYKDVVGNLQLHDPSYPDYQKLSSRVKTGNTGYAMSAVGDGKSSGGSNLIISAVDKNDPRPVWVLFWGGGNTLAQALHDVKKTRSASEVSKFASKIRVFDIAGQDDAGAWITKNFPEVLYIRAVTQWKGMSRTVKNYWPESHGGNEEVVSNEWYRNNIQDNKGPLGAAYPNRKFLFEGDIPSLFHVLPTGLSNPEKPHYGNWAGRFKREPVKNPYSEQGWNTVKGSEVKYADFYMYGQDKDSWSYKSQNYNNYYCALFRWREDFQNNFAGRMDWCLKSFADANHEPVLVLNGDQSKKVVYIPASAGQSVTLSAAGSTDPDGDNISYHWWYYKEPGTYSGNVSVSNSGSQVATVNIPSNASKGDSIHIVLTARDNGSPVMTSYRRAVIVIGEGGTDPIPPPVSIEPPSDLSTSEITDTSVKLIWNDNSSVKTAFRVFKSTTNNSSDFNLVYTTPVDVKTHLINGLSPLTEYYFRVKSVYEDEVSDFSNILSVTTLEGEPGTGNPLNPPHSPSDLLAEEVDSHSILIKWKDNSDDEDGFSIELAEGSNEFGEIHRTDNNVTSYLISGLNQGTEYRIRVRAFNEAGYSTDNSTNTINVTTELVSSIPTSVKPVVTIYPNPGNGAINLIMTNLEKENIKDIKVVNLIGRELYSTSINDGTFNDEFFFDLSHLPNGVYILIGRGLSDQVLFSTRFIIKR